MWLHSITTTAATGSISVTRRRRPPIVYLSPPPPSPKKPPSVYCPPPPSSPSYQYITGPPGNLYPVDENFSGATPTLPHSFSYTFFPLLVPLLAFYW
ncbi:putative leucine-rich repeat extensin-like protein 6 [Sesbania bispinosa]|nr:putative leucine-rich repeat extensin-like protein 6 [Sesbania bispinosa]